MSNDPRQAPPGTNPAQPSRPDGDRPSGNPRQEPRPEIPATSPQQEIPAKPKQDLPYIDPARAKMLEPRYSWF